MVKSAVAVAGRGVSVNPYFYRSEEMDEGLSRDEDCDDVSVGDGFLTICCKMKNRVQFTVSVGDVFKECLKPLHFTNFSLSS
jgi:hypothetical protein